MSEPSLVILGATPTPRRRRYVLVGAGVLAVMIVAGAASVPMLRGETEVHRADRVYRGLGDVRVYEGLSVGHTSGEVDYGVVPPVGGAHDPAWLACGSYDEPVRDENAVHDLEHGAVWITYRPDLAPDEIAMLRSRLPSNGIMSPYPGLAGPVVITVWGRQLDLTGADDSRLELFIATFGHGETAPEPNASCAGGISDPGGRTTTAV
ncbi:DUF3105 domain-containing protein [Nocardioides sp.]|uniref:DUF3105 domain-containing protein n=1 Tax=Nocardioides sp. TaxID=35761 RepID=UPI0039E7125B